MDTTTYVSAEGVNLLGLLGTVLWHALRIGAALQVMPPVAGRGIPARARLILTLALAGTLSAWMPPPPPAAIDASTVATVLREFVIGIALGMMVRMAFEAGRLAGELVSQGMGLSFATLADPLSGSSSSVVSQWFWLVFGLLFFATNAHLAFFELVLGSYRTLPVGMALPDTHALLAAIPAFFATCLKAGVLLALPVMVALLTINLSFGVLGKAAPALNPIAIGMPVALLSGLALLTVLSGRLQAPVQRIFDDALLAARALVGG